MIKSNDSLALSLFDESINSKSTTDIAKELSKATDSLQAAKLAYAFCSKKAYYIPASYKDAGELLTEITARTNIIDDHHLSLIKTAIEARARRESDIASSLITMTAKYKFRHRYKQITSLSQIDIKKTGVTVLSAPHGIGKTELVGIPFINHAGKDKKAVSLVHLRSLTAEISERFEAKNYQDLKEQVRAAISQGIDKETASRALFDGGVHKLAICAPSITSELAEYLSGTDTLLIDEISQLLSFLTSDKLKIKAKSIFDKLVSMVKDAKRVLVMDADLDDTVLTFLELCRPNEKFTIYELPRPQTTEFNVKLHCSANFLKDAENAILAALEQKKRLIVAMDSLTDTEALEKLIKAHYPKTKMLVINKKTTDEKAYKKNKLQLDFMQAPNEHAHKYQVVIHSPTIRSGISITKGGFNLCVGVFQGTSVTPSEAIQMIRRDRKNRDFILCMQKPIYKAFNTVGEAILGTEQAASERSGTRAYTSAYDNFVHTQEQKQAKAMSNFSSHLVLMLKLYGFNLTRDTEENSEESAIKQIKKEQKEEYRALVMQSQPLPLDRAEELKQAGELTIENLAQIEASKICALFDSKFVTMENFTQWDDGLAIKRARLLNAITGKSGANEEKTNDLSTNLFDDVKAKFISQLISKTSLAINESGIDGMIAKDEEKPLAKMIFKNKFMLARLGLISAKVSKMTKAPTEPKRIIKTILEHAGIELNTKQERTGERKDNKRETNLKPNKASFLLSLQAASNVTEVTKPPAERQQENINTANDAFFEAMEQERIDISNMHNSERETWQTAAANKNEYAILSLLRKTGEIDPNELGYMLNKTYPITPTDYTTTLDKIFRDGLITQDEKTGMITASKN